MPDLPDPKRIAGRLVHEMLAHAYLVFLAAIVGGFGIDALYKSTAIAFDKASDIGIALIILGTLLVYWAQRITGRTSGDRNVPDHEITKEQFLVGPYRYLRAPTQLGLFMMTAGLAFLYSSVSMLATSLAAYLIARMIFIPIEERQLEKKYGQPYVEYKNIVRF